ncbi:transient receptor potential channel pyrexia-like [Schistocerca gregaria]|uniref:transient receptor potential channel pyrexia-like n=1 Tax=Schistocerca gregaria TaxID=7010 RepID=UPI00211DDE12|nr:transient receptor potential channel pyrexia-like [Schistocerca gregaria]
MPQHGGGSERGAGQDTRVHWQDGSDDCGDISSEEDVESGALGAEAKQRATGVSINRHDGSPAQTARGGGDEGSGNCSAAGGGAAPACPRSGSGSGELWARADVEAGLRALPGADAAAPLVAAGDAEALLQRPADQQDAALLLAAWQGRAALVHQLLLRGRTDRLLAATDADGRSALHLACYAGEAEAAEAVLRAGGNAAARRWDAAGRATALHCAASAGCERAVRLLLAAGADVNAGLQAGSRSPLHCAVLSDAPACVRELLAAGACPNTPQVYTETPLHVAAAMGYSECARLLLEGGADVRVAVGAARCTPLHLAAEDGNADCARMLLDAGADPNAQSRRRQTPLHLAALAQAAGTLELLLQRGARPDAEDDDGRTPLHSAIVKVSRSLECVRLLVGAGASVNRADKFGYTPLHLAALNEFSACAALLLERGADVTARTRGGVSALSFLVRRVPDVIPALVTQLDGAVTLHDHELGDVDCELRLDFRVLVPNAERGESGLLLAFIEVGLRHLLKHPLCEAFLCLKWRRIRKFFLLSLLFHAVFVFAYTVFVLTGAPRPSAWLWLHAPAGYLLLALNTLLLAKELFQMVHSRAGYLRSWENWLQWLIIASAFLCWFGGAGEEPVWQRHVLALGIFLTWLELMLLVGRFPVFGLYVQMFTTVAVNFAKFLMAYCCLLVAFSLSFGVIFHHHAPFKGALRSVLKTVVMMSGELEFEDIFYDADQPLQYAGTAHLLFFGFVLLVTVILTNLLVGLAVSDIQGLQRSAGLDRLVRQAELVAHLESALFSRLLTWLPPRLLSMAHRSALLLTSPYHSSVYVRPNHPQADRLPAEIARSAYRLVAERRSLLHHPGRINKHELAYSVFFDPTEHDDELCTLRRVASAPTDRMIAHVKAMHAEQRRQNSLSEERFNKITSQLDELQNSLREKSNSDEQHKH